MQEPTLIIDLTTEPISLALAKAYIKVDEAVPLEDSVIELMLKAARKRLEKYTGLAFGPKTFQVKTYGYVKDSELLYGPNQTITEVLNSKGEVIDIATLQGTWHEYLRGFTVQNTFVDEFGYDGIPKGIYGLGSCGLGGGFDGGAFGSLAPEPEYTITYTAGYEEGKLPEDLQLAIAKLVADMYDNRSNSVTGTIIAELPLTSKTLADPYRKNVLFV